jgi:hypothetical protein
MPASLICQHEDKIVRKILCHLAQKDVHHAVLALGKIREVILPKAGQPAVET